MAYYERNLPHWHPEGCAIFVTWRLYGSLPESVLAELKRSKKIAGRQFARAEQFLDQAEFGPTWLRDARIAALVQSSILKGAAELNEYALLAYVIMPNHVHMLVQPRTAMQRVTKGIKGVTARAANLLLGRVGRPFWQAESFDHWARTETESEKIGRYIENNPVKAGLVRRAEEWRWSSAAK
jgi:putative transposase